MNSNSTFCSDVYLDYSVDSALLNNSEELNIRNFQLRTCVRRPKFADFKRAEDIENWPTSGISCLTSRKLKPSLNMAQEISWSVSLRTAIIFGSFV